MQDNINKVIEFQKTTGSPVLTSPALAPNHRASLRAKLLGEEVDEFENAAYQKDLVEVLDALVDIQYILNGTIVEFGLQDVFQEAFDEVHRSNMSKFTKTTFEAQESVKKYQFKGIDTYYKKVGAFHVIMRTSDDKVLKGRGYSAPALKEILLKAKADVK